MQGLMQLTKATPLYDRNQPRHPSLPAKKRSMRVITVGEQSLTVSEWAKKRGERPQTIYARMLKGMTEQQAVTVKKSSRQAAFKAGREKAKRVYRGLA